MPVEEHEAGMVFELAVGGPLHADELRRKHGESGMAEGDDRLRIGDRVDVELGYRRCCGFGSERTCGLEQCTRYGGLRANYLASSNDDGDCGKVKQGIKHGICSSFFISPKPIIHGCSRIVRG